jgi:ABC-type polysaccharide/polyol phosphate export permease
MRFHDSFYLVGMAVQIGFWLTPVIWNPGTVVHIWRPLLWGNPMAGVLALYRWMLGIGPAVEPLYAVGLGTMVALFYIGWLRFFQRQGTLADTL